MSRNNRSSFADLDRDLTVVYCCFVIYPMTDNSDDNKTLNANHIDAIRGAALDRADEWGQCAVAWCERGE